MCAVHIRNVLYLVCHERNIYRRSRMSSPQRFWLWPSSMLHTQRNMQTTKKPALNDSRNISFVVLSHCEADMLILSCIHKGSSGTILIRDPVFSESCIWSRGQLKRYLYVRRLFLQNHSGGTTLKRP